VKTPPLILDRITDIVLAYKPKWKAPAKRSKRSKAIKKARRQDNG